MKKPGLLKRIFSFGKKKQEEPAEEIMPDEEPVEIVIPDEVNAETTLEAPVEKPEIKPVGETDIALNDETFIDSPPKQTEDIKDLVTPKTKIPDFEVEEHPDSDKGEGNEKDEVGEIVKSQPHPDEPSHPPSSVIDDEPDTGSFTKTHIVLKSKAVGVVEAEPADAPKTPWYRRLSSGLSRSSSQLSNNIAAVFTKKKLDEEVLEELEDVLLQADIGFETTMNIVDSLAKQRLGKNVTDEEVRTIMAEEIEKALTPVAMPLELDLEHKPHVILVVGVNGSGKTTTIGKLSQKLNDSGYSTMLVAGDTFRAAAIEQLKIWGERTGSKVISSKLGSDSAGLAYDAWQQAKDAGSDVLMMDTAGRLQNRTELMAELEKIIRVLKKHDPAAPHTVLLTLDATTGQNALNQVEVFGKVAGVNGLIMTKLDGSARGGILVAISAKYKLPVYFVGVGEQVEDLEPFEAQDFARSLAGLNA
jgi:fused signal recognition particle receptor